MNQADERPKSLTKNELLALSSLKNAAKVTEIQARVPWAMGSFKEQEYPGEPKPRFDICNEPVGLKMTF